MHIQYNVNMYSYHRVNPDVVAFSVLSFRAGVSIVDSAFSCNINYFQRLTHGCLHISPFMRTTH